ncbi:MAG: E3 binding domain-containing protein, partial [Spirochaetes bacterium]|nr:E3 binding domain-containing protein [Spirochaetota bacterium]
MAETIVMIALSPTMNEGLVAEWKLQEGDSFKSGDALCEVETDKATMTYEAPASGTLLKILLPAGSQAQVGQAIAVYGKPGEDWQSAAGATAQAAAAPPATMPASTAQADQSAKAAGQVPALPELPPSKPVPPVTAPEPASRITAVAPAESAIRGQTPTLPSGIPPSSPLARKLASQAGVDLRTINGSGPNGRVVARDLSQAQRSGQNATGIATTAANKAAPGGAIADRIVPLSRMRSIIADRLGESYRNAPHYYVRMAIEMDRLLSLRAQLNQGRDTK